MSRMSYNHTSDSEQFPHMSMSMSAERSLLQSNPPPPTDCIQFDFDRKNRTLVLCFDGTCDQFDETNSNVVDFFSMLEKSDKTRQLVHYQAGFGTGTFATNDNTSALKSWFNNTLDAAVAWNLKHHMLEAYHFLSENYVNGDRICLFGFSRGAYIARALAGMLHKVGLLPPGNNHQAPFAYNLYTRTDPESWKLATQFKSAFTSDVTIHFIGVWDTVRSVGLLDIPLPFSASNTSIAYFRQALSLDECRTKFKANHWATPTFEEQELGSKYADREPTNVKEVWFAGVHCDIGGGSVPNGTEHSLSKVSLQWMVKETFRCKTGIIFKVEGTFSATRLYPDLLRQPVVDVTTSRDISRFSAHAQPMVPSYIQGQHIEDALMPIHDQLVASRKWWIFELFPMWTCEGCQTHPHARPICQGKRKTCRSGGSYSLNLGQGRTIPIRDTDGRSLNIYVHYTVHERIKRINPEERQRWWPFWWTYKQPYKPKAANWDKIYRDIIWTN